MIDYEKIPKINIFENSKNNFSIRKHKDEMLLVQGINNVWMSANQKNSLNHKQQYSSYDLAYGDVLITGLGFGIIACWIYEKPGVTSITVWEKNQEVIDMFFEANPEWLGKIKVEKHNCDTYKSNERFDCILADHFEYLDDEQTISVIKNLSNNVPNHDLMWFWSLEKIYISKEYNINNKNLSIRPVGEYIRKNNLDFSDKWFYFLDNSFKNIKISRCSPEKINEYVFCYFDPSDTPKLFIC